MRFVDFPFAVLMEAMPPFFGTLLQNRSVFFDRWVDLPLGGDALRKSPKRDVPTMPINEAMYELTDKQFAAQNSIHIHSTAVRIINFIFKRKTVF